MVDLVYKHKGKGVSRPYILCGMTFMIYLFEFFFVFELRHVQRIYGQEVMRIGCKFHRHIELMIFCGIWVWYCLFQMLVIKGCFMWHILMDINGLGVKWSWSIKYIHKLLSWTQHTVWGNQLKACLLVRK